MRLHVVVVLVGALLLAAPAALAQEGQHIHIGLTIAPDGGWPGGDDRLDEDDIPKVPASPTMPTMPSLTPTFGEVPGAAFVLRAFRDPGAAGKLVGDSPVHQAAGVAGRSAAEAAEGSFEPTVAVPEAEVPAVDAGEATLDVPVPDAPSTTVARVPTLDLDVALPGAAVNVCVGPCAPAAAQPGPHADPDGAAGDRAAHAPDAALPAGSDEAAPPAALGALAPAPGDARAAPAPRAGPMEVAALAPGSVLPAHGSLLAVTLVALGLLAPFASSLYSKIRRDATLLNATRRMVYEAVVNQPGLSIQEVARRAGMSHSTAAYHLERLARAGLVVATGDGNKMRYYRNGGRFSEQERLLLPCLENKETVEVLEAVLRRPSTYRAELAAQLGVTSTTVSWHLKRLFRAGAVLEQRRGRNAHLFVARDPLRAACAGLHEKIAPSPARDAAARILAELAASLAQGPGAAPLPAAASTPAPAPARDHGVPGPVPLPLLRIAPPHVSPRPVTIGRLETL